MLRALPGTELAQAREVLGAEIDTLDTAKPYSIRAPFSFVC
jgi:malonate decarboxylase epsilon subunit